MVPATRKAFRLAQTAHNRTISAWPMQKRIAALVMAFAAVMAWIHLERASIWYDEAITLLTTSGNANLRWPLGMQQFKPTLHLGRILFDLYNQDVHPPLYFWALAIWRSAFGASLEVARSFSALFILASLVLLYRLAKDLGVRPWVPVAIYAASSVGSWYAYDARPYAMATFLILLTQVLAIRRSRWAGVCGAAAVATHYFAALCVAPIVAVYGVMRWRADRRWTLLTAGSFVVCCAPLIKLLRVHLMARPHQYPGFGWFPVELWALLKGAVQGSLPNTWLPGWGVALVLGAFFAGAGMWFALRHKKPTVPILYGSFLLGFLLLAIVTNKSITEMPSAYYLGIAAPFLALLVGYGVSAFPRVSPLLAAAVIVGLIAAKPIVQMQDYRQMVDRMKTECSQCSILVTTGYAGAVPACVLYESRGMPVFLLTPNDSATDVAERLGGQGTVFFIPTNEPPTQKVEQEFLQEYLSARRNGYFEVSLNRPASRERASNIPRPAIPMVSSLK